MGIKKFFINTEDREFMNLSVKEVFVNNNRAMNCLRRGGIHTIGDLVNHIELESDLLKIRNCGDTTATAIMQELFDSYIEHVTDQGKLADYLIQLAFMQKRSK